MSNQKNMQCFQCKKEKKEEDLFYFDEREEKEWYNGYPCHLCRECQPELQRYNSNDEKMKKSIDVCEICEATSQTVASDKWNDENAFLYVDYYPKRICLGKSVKLCNGCKTHWYYVK